MAVVRMKDQVGRWTREVASTCKAGVRSDVLAGTHVIVTHGSPEVIWDVVAMRG